MRKILLRLSSLSVTSSSNRRKQGIKGTSASRCTLSPGTSSPLRDRTSATRTKNLGDKLNLRLAFRKEGDKYYVEILNVDLVKKDNTVPLLTRKQYAVTDDLAHQAVRTICHKFIELTVPDEVPAEPDEAPAEPDGHSIH